MYKNIIYFTSFPFITWNVCMGRERERERQTVENSQVYTHTHTNRLSNKFAVKPLRLFLCSLLSWDWYRAISRYWIILVSPCFSTLVNLVQKHLKTLSHSFALLLNPWQSGARLEPRVIWCLVATFRGLSHLLFVSAGYIIFQTPIEILMVIPPVCCLQVKHFHWGNTCILFTLGNRFISCLFLFQRAAFHAT